LACLFLVFITVCLSFPTKRFRDIRVPEHDNRLPIAAEWFTQRLDHFDWQEQRVWKQRYFTNATFWNPKNKGPIFLQVGGEGGISDAYVVYVEMALNFGKKYGALMFVLEHRFYGESKPLPDLSTPNLRYLSSQQALADLSTFIEAMKIKYNAQDSPVITFGGSYPGSLAAWFRLKFPHQTIAAVASSAPVQAELDFFQYLNVVDQSLSAITGPLCDKKIKEATDIIQNMLQTESGTKKLEDLFSICTPLQGEKDVATFISNLMGNFMETVQYDNEMGSINIQALCNIMTNGSDALTSYVGVSNLFLSLTGQTCLDCSYADQLAQVTNISQVGDGVGIRQWTYQTCTEFGYFQTTDSSSNRQPFGNLVPLSYYTDLCRQAFGFNFLPGINATNNYYGGNKPYGATKILFVNGSLDPWHALSVRKDLTDSITVIYINGTAHCADMSPPSPADPPSLAIAQQKISDQIGQWLKEASN